MSAWFSLRKWSPYAVGIALGVLSWITFGFMSKALGTSTSMVKLAGAAECLVAPAHADANAYLAANIGTAAKRKAILDWQLALVAMLPIGAFVSARLARAGGEPRFVEHVPKVWAWRFGPSRPLRYAAAFFGGIVLIIGARLADGCTSGHGISGGLQFAVSSWTFFGAMFVSGVVAAFALFGFEGRKHV
ncbi:MAG: YeeE/YedE family protein [Phycisphaeraceae bacterium]|nr:YeeE/YedE family protein [Phycisphaeraceae bacterium]